MSTKNLKINSMLNVIKTLSSIIFPIVTFPYVSRILQPENIGKVNFAQSFVSYFTLIASLGITTYAIRECSAVRNDKETFEKKASEIYSVNVCTTLISYLLLTCSLFLFKNLEGYEGLIIIQSITILFTTVGTDWLNTVVEDFWYITIRTIVFQILSLILIFVFIRSSDDYIKYACILVFASSGVNILNIFYRKKFCAIHFTTQMKFKDHFKPIFLMFVMILAQTIFKNADVTMLGFMKGDFEVGIYSTATKIENTVAQVVASLAWVVMPRLSIYFAEKDYKKINSMLKKISEVMLLIGLPSITGVMVLSKEIVLIVGGSQYVESEVSLIILMVSFLFDLFGGSFLGNMVFLPSKNEKKFMLICCITAVINVILNYIMIPVGGVNAAAGTTALSSLIIMIMLIITKDKEIDISYWRKVIILPLIGSFAICLFCLCIKWFIRILLIRMAVCMLGSIVLYALIMLVFKNSICIDILMLMKKKILKLY